MNSLEFSLNNEEKDKKTNNKFSIKAKIIIGLLIIFNFIFIGILIIFFI